MSTNSEKNRAIQNSKNLLLVPHTGNLDFVVRAPSPFKSQWNAKIC